MSTFNNSTNSISLSWNQPDQESDVVMIMSYHINYSYTVNYGCQLSVSNNFTVNIGGNLRNYTLLNTSENLIEEDSIYTISITAINPVGSSQASTTVQTLPSGGSLLLLY